MTDTLKPETIREAWPVLAALPFPVMHINTDFTVIAANPAAVERYGAERGKCFRISRGYESPCENYGSLCPMRAAEGASAPVSVLHVHQAKDGVERCKVTASPILGGGILEFHIPLEDVTTIDMLTGLVNRSEGEQLLRHSAALMRRRGLGYTLLALDLDHFKRINDTFGHPQGDQVLKAFARSLRETVRESDIAVRWGGEEFLVMLPGEGAEAAEQLAGRILDAIRRLKFSVEGAELGITVSAGIRLVEAHEAQSVTFDDVVRDADTALYEAKRAGRDRHRLWGQIRVSEETRI
jgi:diguanylate cyclase (GGDEF)-like protein